MKWSRRRFVATLGAAAATAPIARAFLRGRAVAQSTDIPVRFLGVRTYHGTDRQLFIPRQSGGSEPGGTDMSLSELTFDYENAFLSPLQDWRDRITVLDGLDHWVCEELGPGHHGHEEQATGLTGAATTADGGISNGHPSVDFYLHSRLSAPALLIAGAGSDGGWKSMTYNDGGDPPGATQDPAGLFRQAFPGDFRPEDPEQRVDYSGVDRAVFEHSIASLDRLKLELTGVERQKLEAHTEAMHRLVGNLDAPLPVAACTTSGSDGPAGGSGDSYQDLESVTDRHAQVIAQAFACGRARSATLRIGSDWVCPQSELPEIQALGLGDAFGGDYAGSWRFHENLVHDYWGSFDHPRFEVMQRAYALGQQWQTDRFVSILEALDAVPDPMDPSGTSTVLDNTIVYWGNEFGHGPHDSQARHIPAVIAGGGAGRLRMGRYLRLREPTGSSPVPHNRLLTSICQAMGLSDVGFFGDRELRDNPGAYARYHGELTELMS